MLLKLLDGLLEVEALRLCECHGVSLFFALSYCAIGKGKNEWKIWEK